MYSFFVLDVMKSSSTSFQVTLCLGVKKKNLARQQALTIYQKVTSQSTICKIPYAEAQIGLQKWLGIKCSLGYHIYLNGGEVHSKDLVWIVGIYRLMSLNWEGKGKLENYTSLFSAANACGVSSPNMHVLNHKFYVILLSQTCCVQCDSWGALQRRWEDTPVRV